LTFDGGYSTAGPSASPRGETSLQRGGSSRRRKMRIALSTLFESVPSWAEDQLKLVEGQGVDAERQESPLNL